MLTRPRARSFLALTLALLCLGAGVWLYRNAYLPRLRGEFIPWMHRLERWRDGIEQVQRALKRREPGPGDPAGITMLRNWAWDGLERIAFITHEVRPPAHGAAGAPGETSGVVYFTVGGFRKSGIRVERSAAATVTIGPPLVARLTRVMTERAERHPRFRNATEDSGLGALRRDPPAANGTNRLIAGIWPGSGVAVLDYDGDGDEDLFVGDSVRSILWENDGAGCFTDATERAGLASSADDGVAATGVGAGDVDGDGMPDLFVTNSFGSARLFRNAGGGVFRDATAESGIRTPANARSAAFADVDGDGDLDLFVCVTGDYYGQMPDPPYDAEDGARNLLFVN
ncbi:MAG TPA: VCBS repeat-containing protein, partial [Thermoanaerobaculia bacterium]|nr:VCBS repeat-containing protein [Thermoanaerobaculia bacterium]